MNSIGKIFARGLLTLIPIVLTLYIVTQVILIFDGFLGTLLETLLPPDYYLPGLGLVLSFTLIYLFGLFLNYYLAQRFIYFFERQILKIPLLKAIYSPLRDLVQLFGKNNNKMGHPVLVNLPHLGVKAFGVVTRENFPEMPTLSDQLVSVYIPLSYALGGYTLFVPRSQIEDINLPIEKAMSSAITGWIKSPNQREGTPP